MRRRPPYSPLFPYPTLSRPPTATSRWTRRARPAAPALGRAVLLAMVILSAGAGSASAAEVAAVLRDPVGVRYGATTVVDRKSTRLNSSHANILYAVFFLKKK